MTFDQIRYFIAVMESNTFFEAAEKLHITQSTLSKQIMKLEKELEVRLLDRSRRRASVTEAEKLFYQDCLRLSDGYENMLGHLAPYRHRGEQVLCLGTLPVLPQYHLTSKLREFSERYPELRLILEEVEEPELLPGFLSGKYDIIISRKNVAEELNAAFFSLADDRLFAIVPDSEALCRKLGFSPELCRELFSPCPSPLSLERLGRVPLILMNRYTSIFQFCIRLFQSSATCPSIVRTGRVESIISAVSIGEGVSLLPGSNFEIFHHENVRLIPLKENTDIPIVMCMKKGGPTSPAQKKLIDFFQKMTPS